MAAQFLAVVTICQKGDNIVSSSNLYGTMSALKLGLLLLLLLLLLLRLVVVLLSCSPALLLSSSPPLLLLLALRAGVLRTKAIAGAVHLTGGAGRRGHVQRVEGCAASPRHRLQVH